MDLLRAKLPRAEIHEHKAPRPGVDHRRRGDAHAGPHFARELHARVHAREEVEILVGDLHPHAPGACLRIQVRIAIDDLRLVRVIRQVIERDLRRVADMHVREICLVDVGLDPHVVEPRDSKDAHPRVDRVTFDDVLLDDEAARRGRHGDAVDRSAVLHHRIDLPIEHPEEPEALSRALRHRLREVLR